MVAKYLLWGNGISKGLDIVKSGGKLNRAILDRLHIQSWEREMAISGAKVPVRLNFLGGWSDQEFWRYPAGVVNAAVGWMTPDGMGPHPIVLTDGQPPVFLHEGVGTGLGVSSILEGANYILGLRGEDPSRGYIRHVLGYEREEGTRGGWQDQVGGIEPGVKLICGWDHRKFAIIHLPRPAWWDHLVLFDTRIRRRSEQIGRVVRALMVNENKAFTEALRRNVADAMAVTELNTPEAFSKACIAGWRRLCSYIPAMGVEPPNIDSLLIWGYMLVGAGGGGYGIEFVKDPAKKGQVIQDLNDAGWWGAEPVLLDGIKLVDESGAEQSPVLR